MFIAATACLNILRVRLIIIVSLFSVIHVQNVSPFPFLERVVDLVTRDILEISFGLDSFSVYLKATPTSLR